LFSLARKGIFLAQDTLQQSNQQEMDELRHHHAEAQRLRSKLGLAEQGEVIVRETIRVEDDYRGYVEVAADGLGNAIVTEYQPGFYLCEHEIVRCRQNIVEKEARQLAADWVDELSAD